MDTLFQQVGDPLALLPLAYGLAVFVLLMLLYRWLRRVRALRWVAVPYTLGALALGVAYGLRLALDRAAAPMDAGTYEVLLATLGICWGLVALGLAEELLIDRWIIRRGAAVPRLVRDIVRAA